VTLSNLALFHRKKSFRNPQKKKSRSQIWRVRGPGNGPHFLSNDQENTCPEKHELVK
jgi:hypothetical protein